MTMEALGMLFSLSFLFFPVLFVGVIVYLVVRRRNGGPVITAYHALISYFHLVTAASVVTASVGIGYLAFAALSLVYGGRAPIDDNLTLGFTLLCTGAVICALHVWGRRAVEKREEKATTMLRRIYLFSMLAIFSLTGLGAVPVAIHDVVRYYFTGHRQGSAPAESLAVALVVTPLWAYYLWRVLREMRGSGPTDEATAVSPS
jgi:hypothetical protein